MRVTDSVSVLILAMEPSDVRDIILGTLSRNTLLNLKHRDLTLRFKKKKTSFTLSCNSQQELLVRVFKPGFMCIPPSLSETHRFDLEYLLLLAGSEDARENFELYYRVPTLRDMSCYQASSV